MRGLVVAIGDPQHQSGQREFDQPREQEDPEPQRHLVADGTTALCNRIEPSGWQSWRPRLRAVAAARDWSPGASRWRMSGVRLSPIRATGAVRCRALATPRRE